MRACPGPPAFQGPGRPFAGGQVQGQGASTPTDPTITKTARATACWPPASPAPAIEAAAALLSAANPKNGGLTIAAAASIAGAGLAGGEQAVALAVFVLIGSAGVLAPLVLYLAAGERAARTLESWRRWASSHNAAIMAVLFLVFGFKLIGDGIAVLF